MLDYFALGLLFFTVLVLFYGIIVIHDIPYEIAKARSHPQQDAIHVAGWISLFTLHTIWPFLWIWATLYRPDRGWGFLKEDEAKADLVKVQNLILQIQAKLNSLETAGAEDKSRLASLSSTIQQLQSRLEALEKPHNEPKEDKP